MGLTKYAIGDLIELVEETNAENKYGPDDVRGMTITKEIIPTKADVANTDLSRFWVVHPKEFIYNPRTHGKHIGFGYNDTQETFIISWNNIAFRVKDCMKSIVLPEYLFMHFNRKEWDREACYRSWGSSTEVFSWDALCEMTLDLPPLEIQQKYVDIYYSLLENQRSYERGVDDLKLVCDGYIEDIRRKIPCEKIAPYLIYSDNRNILGLGIASVRGITTAKELIPTKADMGGVDLTNYKTVLPDQFAYVPDTSRRGEKISLGLNRTGEIFLVSSISEVFGTKREQLLPEYLMLFFARTEFDRYARFNSWGSAREAFSYSDMCEVQIPVPDIKTQRALSKIFSVYNQRKEINEKLKMQIKNICSVLIKGSLIDGADV